MKAAMTRAGRTAHGAAEVATSPATADAVRCPHTAQLAGYICDDAVCLVELLTDLIGEAVEYTNELACARLMLARMGMVAHQIRDAHRTDGCSGGWYKKPEHWLLVSGGADPDMEAWEALGRRAAP